jgi:hypothetical protein
VTKPVVGQLIERSGQWWRVIAVWPRLTPYRKENQDTRVEGWTLGLERVKP